MNFIEVPPGDDPMADAFNLMVAADMASDPKTSATAELIVKTITKRVTDWELVAAHLAMIAAKFGSFADQAMPQGHPKPTDQVGRNIASNPLVPA